MIKIYGCVLMVKIEMANNQQKILKLIEIYKTKTTEIYGKIMASMLTKCYEKLPAIVAQQVFYNFL